MSRRHWTAANRIELLCGGEAFFPRVFDAIRAAEREVVIETFIVFEDKVGNELHAVLADAARRGVAIDLLLDGFGCADLSATWIGSLTELGVRIRIFDPGRRLFGQRLNIFRRMHRKITVVDGRIGFIGGINFSADQLIDFGPMAKLDYSAEVEGPIVTDLHRFVPSRCPTAGPKAFTNDCAKQLLPSGRWRATLTCG